MIIEESAKRFDNSNWSIGGLETDYHEKIYQGNIVEFIGKDSYFKGVIVCIFKKLDNQSIRCVVQDDRGLLLIKDPKKARKVHISSS